MYFPVIIYNSSDTDLRDNAQSDGGDIVFVDSANLTQYDHEIEKFDSSTGELIVWVEITNIFSNQDTILYMYYGNPSCANQWDIAGTWNSNYKMVHHLNETSGVHFDSTSNYNNGTVSGTITQGATGQNQMDGSDYFSDGTGIINFDNDSSLTPQTLTLEAWVKDPPLLKSVSIVDKQEEHVKFNSNNKLSVKRTITSNSFKDVVFVALYSPGVILQDMVINEDSVFLGIYSADIPGSKQERDIEQIRNKLPDKLKRLGNIAYSKPFKIDDLLSLVKQIIG